MSQAMRAGSKLATAMVVAAALITHLTANTALADTSGPSLWIADDVTRNIYQVTTNGELRSSFPAEITTNGTLFFRIFPSDVAKDPFTNTLWIVQERPGRLVNYTKTGDQLSIIPLEDRFPGVEPEGVTVDYFNGTLWVVDDPPGDVLPETVYNFERDGSLIGTFSADRYSNDVTSQQGIAADPIDGSL